MQIHYSAGYEPEWDNRDGFRQSSGGPSYRGPELPDKDPKKHLFLKVNLLLTGLAAIPIWWHIREAWKYMSFAGFGSLMVLFFMMPGFLCLVVEAVLFYNAMRWEKRKPVVAAHILQIICGIPSTYFLCLDPGFFWALSVYTVLMVVGVIGLVRLLCTRRR